MAEINNNEDLINDLIGKDEINTVVKPSDSKNDYERRNMSKEDDSPSSGHYRSQNEIDCENVGDAIEETMVRNPQAESSYRQGESKMKELDSLSGFSTQGTSKIGAYASLNKIYENDDSISKIIGDDTYKYGNYRTHNVLNDYRSNVNAIDSYLERNGIRNAKSLNEKEIKQALDSGVLKRDASNEIRLDSNMRKVLAEKTKLIKLEDSAKAATAKGKLRQTGDNWLKKTYENSDANSGVKMLKTSEKTIKVTAKATKGITSSAIKTTGKAVLNTAFLPATMINNANRAILNIKVKHGERLERKTSTAQNPLVTKDITGASDLMKPDVSYKLMANKTKLEAANTRHEKFKDIKTKGNSKINNTVNDPLRFKAVKAEISRETAAWHDSMQVRSDIKYRTEIAINADKKKKAAASGKSTKKYDRRDTKLNAKMTKKHNQLGRRLNRKKFANTKVGKVLSASFKVRNKISAARNAMRKAIMKYFAIFVGITFAFGIAGFGICALFAGGNDEDHSEQVRVSGVDAVADLSDDDADTLGNFLAVMPDDSDCYRYIDTDWASAPIAPGSGTTTARAIYDRLSNVRNGYLQNLLYADRSSSISQYGIPQSWYDQVVNMEDFDEDINPNFIISNTSGNVIGFDIRNFWGPAVEHDGIILKSEDFESNANINFIEDYGNTDENSRLIISAQPGLTNIGGDLASDDDVINYDSSDDTLISNIITSSSVINMGTNPNVTATVSYGDDGDADTMFTSMMVVTQLVVGGGKPQSTYINYLTALFNHIMDDAQINISYSVENDTTRNIFFNWNNKRFTTTPAKKVITTVDIAFPYSSVINIYNNYAGLGDLNTTDYVDPNYDPLNDLVEPAYVPTEDDYGITAEEFRNRFGDYRSCAYYFFYEKLGNNAKSYFYMN